MVIEMPNAGILKQNQLNARYEKLARESQTWFNRDSGAYRFTNEPLEDIVGGRLNLAGPVLAITGAADIMPLLAGIAPRGVLKSIDCVDVSCKANAWGEWKWQAFLNLSYGEFCAKLVEHEATWKTFPWNLEVSDQARKLYEPMKNSKKRLVETTSLFMEAGYAAASPGCSGFIRPEIYRAYQEKAQGIEVWFHTADFATFFREQHSPGEGYATIYMSNVLDHICVAGHNNRDHLDLSKNRMEPLISLLVDNLAPDGTIAINFQWGDRAKPGAEEVLREKGLRLERLPSVVGACGYMYVARR